MVAKKTQNVQTRAAFFYQSAWYVFATRTQRKKIADGTPEEKALWKSGKRMSDGVFPIRPEVETALLEFESLASVGKTKPEDISCRVLGEIYLREREGFVSAEIHQQYVRYLGQFCGQNFYGNKHAKDICPADVEAWAMKRKINSPNTRRFAYTVLKTMFNWARTNKYITANPIDDLKMPHAVKRQRVVTDSDFHLLMRTSSRQCHAFIIALFNTGRRPNEIARLVRSDVVMKDGCPYGVETTKHKNFKKTGLPEFFPFNATMRKLVAEILARQGKPSDPLFVRPAGGAWNKSAWVQLFRRLRRRTGLKVTAYWFRHEFITRSLAANVPVATVAAIVGNSLEVIQAHYDQSAHLGKSHFTEAIERGTASIPTVA